MPGLPIRFVPEEDLRADVGRHGRAMRAVRDDVIEEFGGEAKVGRLANDGFDVRVFDDMEIDAEGRITAAVARGLKRSFGDLGFEISLSGVVVPAGNEIDAAEIGL